MEKVIYLDYLLSYMKRFQFYTTTIVDYFLNNNVLTILRVINNNSDCFTKDIINFLKDINFKISKSQIYRYIDCLDKYKLVEKSCYLNNNQENGYKYRISLNGLEVLEILSKNFENGIE